MADEFLVKIKLPSFKMITSDKDLLAEFVRHVEETWASIPPEFREYGEFKFNLSSFEAWYYRPETEIDRKDRQDYERLKEKIENSERIRKG